MPAPERTSLAAIVTAGLELVEQGGPAALTMQAVAARVGVRAPSLYKRVRGRDDLLRLVTEATVRELGARLAAAEDPAATPRTNVLSLGRALRGFAHERPAAYQLLFTPGQAPPRADPDLLTAASATVLRAAEGLAGTEHVLDAARTLTAWVHGFVVLELGGAFSARGDVDASFEFGLGRVADSLTRP